MITYHLTMHFRTPENVLGTVAYIARGRTFGEAKRFARAKFKTLHPDYKITGVLETPPVLRRSPGLRYTR